MASATLDTRYSLRVARIAAVQSCRVSYCSSYAVDDFLVDFASYGLADFSSLKTANFFPETLEKIERLVERQIFSS